MKLEIKQQSISPNFWRCTIRVVDKGDFISELIYLDTLDYPANIDYVLSEGASNFISGSFRFKDLAQAWANDQIEALTKHLKTWREPGIAEIEIVNI